MLESLTEADVRRAGEPDRETLRDRAAHAGPIDEGTLVYTGSLVGEIGARSVVGHLRFKELVRMRVRQIRAKPWPLEQEPRGTVRRG